MKQELQEGGQQGDSQSTHGKVGLLCLPFFVPPRRYTSITCLFLPYQTVAASSSIWAGITQLSSSVGFLEVGLGIGWLLSSLVAVVTIAL